MISVTAVAHHHAAAAADVAPVDETVPVALPPAEDQQRATRQHDGVADGAARRHFEHRAAGHREPMSVAPGPTPRRRRRDGDGVLGGIARYLEEAAAADGNGARRAPADTRRAPPLDTVTAARQGRPQTTPRGAVEDGAHERAAGARFERACRS